MDTARYDDGYPTCARTYATFRVYGPDLNPASITPRLGLWPTDSWRRGDPGRSRSPRRRFGGWLLRTENHVDSRDVRRHLDWLVDRLAPSTPVIEDLRAAGYDLDIFCYWLSASGHGGPSLNPDTMRRLSDLGLQLGFDVYLDAATE